MTPCSILLLFFGDATRDRRVQNFARYFKEMGWNVELLALTSTIASGPRKFFDFHRRMQKEVRAKRVDVVMACDLYSLSAAKWMKRNGRTRVLLYDARELYTELPAVARRVISKFVWRTQERQGLMQTNLIIVTAPNDADAIRKVHGFLPRPVLVRNLPWREPELLPDRTLLDRFGIPREAKTIVYLGGLQQGRGLKKLIESMKGASYHLLLIGGGALRLELDALVQKNNLSTNVHLAGPLPSNEALKVTAACDVGISLVEPVSQSYQLALPSKLFEYMMCGLHIVSSRAAQVMDLFQNEEWITFVDEGDAQSIQDGIQSALVNSNNQALFERERELALAEYHFEHDAARLMDVLKTFFD